jgi:hypothetical protein
MDMQDVTIRLRKTSYEVDAVFHLFNTGETTTQWVGFPKRGQYPQYLRFDMWVDGRKVDVKEERDLSSHRQYRSRHPDNGDWWLVHRVKFPRYERTTIRNSYEVRYLLTDFPNRAYYEYGTGSYWKGPIGLAAFTIDGADIGGRSRFQIHGLPASARRLNADGAVRYEIRNFEPSPSGWLGIVIGSAEMWPRRHFYPAGDKLGR